jgi:hypothetical protein
MTDTVQITADETYYRKAKGYPQASATLLVSSTQTCQTALQIEKVAVATIIIRPSNNGLNFVLNGRSRAALRGDGIVPISYQKMSILPGWKQPIRPFNKNSVVHIEESKQVRDLSIALSNIYGRLGWL